ncbi:MAG: glycosyltransferase family 2 protein [Candidatus Omnitrophica bacterium]|nr:glycosyltransferase family 2 protein [Candidatus Omnitrophota bacterium]
MKVWAVIPAYNEANSLGLVLEELQQTELSILVVDDGSTDETAQIAQSAGVTVLRNSENLGKGQSLKNAVQYLFDNEEFDYVITMDADRQHAASDVKGFLYQAHQGEKFVLGNRMNNPQGMPFDRVLTNRFMSWLISALIKQHIPDTQCGFRLIKREVLEKIPIETENFEVDSEFLIKAVRNNIRIKSIPIQSIYHKDSSSKIKPIIDTIRFLRFFFLAILNQ